MTSPFPIVKKSVVQPILLGIWHDRKQEKMLLAEYHDE